MIRIPEVIGSGEIICTKLRPGMKLVGHFASVFREKYGINRGQWGK